VRNAPFSGVPIAKGDKQVASRHGFVPTDSCATADRATALDARPAYIAQVEPPKQTAWFLGRPLVDPRQRRAARGSGLAPPPAARVR
jgi:hypothetical protein